MTNALVVSERLYPTHHSDHKHHHHHGGALYCNNDHHQKESSSTTTDGGGVVAMHEASTSATTSVVPLAFSVLSTTHNDAQPQRQESLETQWPMSSSSCSLSSLQSAPLQQQQHLSFLAHHSSSCPSFASMNHNNLLLLAPPQQQQHHPHAVITHNLIPHHLQATALAASMHGTPGHAPALIPQPPVLSSSSSQLQLQQPISFFAPPPQQQPQPDLLSSAALAAAAAAAAAAAIQQQQQPALTVQDRPMTQPVYNGVNPQYPGLRVLNTSPPIFAVDNFLSPQECDFLIAAAHDSFAPAPVVGKGAGEISPSRTSSTCYLAREDLPGLLHKVQLLTGKPIEHCELPQVGRYLSTQQYMQHYDAFDLSTEDGRRFAMNGGQRVVTVLLYLNTVTAGGATRFPALSLQVQPVQGTALVFFPATVDGLLDQMALHAALPAVQTKYVSQIWIRQGEYHGQPSKRLTTPLL